MRHAPTRPATKLANFFFPLLHANVCDRLQLLSFRSPSESMYRPAANLLHMVAQREIVLAKNALEHDDHPFVGCGQDIPSDDSERG